MEAEFQLSVPKVPTVTTAKPIIIAYIIIATFLAILSLLLWIDRGSALPWWSDQEEIERQKMNNWWLQVYREERKSCIPTGILRHRRNSSHSTESYLSGEGGDFNCVPEASLSSALLATEELKSNWGNKVTKHVRFDIPLTTMSAISAVLAEEMNDSMITTKAHENYRYNAKTWDLLTSLI